MRRTSLWRISMVVLLSGCSGAGAPAAVAPDTRAPATAAARATATPQPGATPTAAAAQSSPEPATDPGQISADGSAVRWHNLSIALPDPAYEWRPQGAQQPPDPLPAPVLDRAQVGLIIDGNGVEQPKGTFFTLVQFSGELEEWLELVRNGPGMPIQASSVQHVRFDERPGIVYQTEFTGLSGEEGVYIVKPTASTLLIIDTEFINSDPLLPGLRIN